MAARTPTVIQLLGLAVTLAAVVAYSLFTLVQLDGLRRLGSDIIDRNRRDSLQLIRIQNDLSQIGLALRDITEGAVPYPMEAFKPEFDRIKGDLEDALQVQERLMPTTRTSAQRSMLQGAFTRFWGETAQLWVLAGEGRINEAKTLIRTRLEAERATRTTVVSRLLMQNNEAEAAAVQEIQLIYGRWSGTSICSSPPCWQPSSSRRAGDPSTAACSPGVAAFGAAKELAGKVITVQEDVFRTLARELHDEFGQVLTALGMMLLRVEKRCRAIGRTKTCARFARSPTRRWSACGDVADAASAGAGRLWIGRASSGICGSFRNRRCASTL